MNTVQEQPSPALMPNLKVVAKAITDGRLVPFLGAAVNLYGRDNQTNIAWLKSGNQKYLPSGAELARHLANEFGYELAENERPDLLRISQYVIAMDSVDALYDELRRIFDRDYDPTPLHAFFARLPKVLRRKGLPATEDPDRRRMVIVTTNYDDVLERAFHNEQQPFHLISYVAERERKGRFLHWAPGLGGEAALIPLNPNDYAGLGGDELPIILKIHGAVDRAARENDSYVITEDDYIEYLTRTDLDALLPKTLTSILKRSQFLFLGYSLGDWNLRAILHRIWRDRQGKVKHWAVQLRPSALDQRFWKDRDVEIIDVDLKVYVEALQSLEPFREEARL